MQTAASVPQADMDVAPAELVRARGGEQAHGRDRVEPRYPRWCHSDRDIGSARGSWRQGSNRCQGWGEAGVEVTVGRAQAYRLDSRSQSASACRPPSNWGSVYPSRTQSRSASLCSGSDCRIREVHHGRHRVKGWQPCVGVICEWTEFVSSGRARQRERPTAGRPRVRMAGCSARARGCPGSRGGACVAAALQPARPDSHRRICS